MTLAILTSGCQMLLDLGSGEPREPSAEAGAAADARADGAQTDSRIDSALDAADERESAPPFDAGCPDAFVKSWDFSNVPSNDARPSLSGDGVLAGIASGDVFLRATTSNGHACLYLDVGGVVWASVERVTVRVRARVQSPPTANVVLLRLQTYAGTPGVAALADIAVDYLRPAYLHVEGFFAPQGWGPVLTIEGAFAPNDWVYVELGAARNRIGAAGSGPARDASVDAFAESDNAGPPVHLSVGVGICGVDNATSSMVVDIDQLDLGVCPR